MYRKTYVEINHNNLTQNIKNIKNDQKNVNLYHKYNDKWIFLCYIIRNIINIRNDLLVLS